MIHVVLLVSCCLASLVSATQLVFEGATLKLGKSWEAAGPWPIGTREWPLNAGPCGITLTSFLQQPYNESLHCDSSIISNTQNLWRRFDSIDERVIVNHWDVNWPYIRSYKGWSGLQHQTLLRTSILVPEDLDAWLEVKGAAFFSLSSAPLEVFHGNFYRYETDYVHRVHLPKGTHSLAVRAVYDVRSNGDPSDRDTTIPIVEFGVHLAKIVRSNKPLHVLEQRTNLPGRLRDGKLTTPWIGLWLQSTADQRLEVVSVKSLDKMTSASLIVRRPLSLLHNSDETQHSPVIFSAWQAQQLAIEVTLQEEATSLHLQIAYRSESLDDLSSIQIDLALPTPAESTELLRYTYLSADKSVQYAMAKPPRARCSEPQSSRPLIVALHGAGGHADTPKWTGSIDPQAVWTVFILGRSPWSFDWHAGGLRDVFESLDPLPTLHKSLFGQGCAPDAQKLIVIGHSNGGQGTWYLGARFPDRVVAMAPAAAYSRIMDYAPFDYETGLLVDPALRAVLYSSLTPYDNVMHLSTLWSTPILAQHGTADSNVPIFHSRRLVETTNSWSSLSPARLVEVEGAQHWIPTVFRSTYIQDFLDRSVSEHTRPFLAYGSAFTLTASNPDESGTCHGFKITRLQTPGQIARLDIRIGSEGETVLESTNVAEVSLDSRHEGRRIMCGGLEVEANSNTTILRLGDGKWEPTSTHAPRSRLIGPAMQIFDGRLPLLIVFGETPRTASAAKRLATAIQLHGGPLVSLVPAGNVARAQLDSHSVIYLGGTGQNEATRDVFDQIGRAYPIHVSKSDAFAIRNRTFAGPGYGLLTLLPHPVRSDAHAMLLMGTDDEGFERALQAFPIISGTPIPEFIVLSSRPTEPVAAAGWFSEDWSWSASMSFVSSL